MLIDLPQIKINILNRKIALAKGAPLFSVAVKSNNTYTCINQNAYCREVIVHWLMIEKNAGVYKEEFPLLMLVPEEKVDSPISALVLLIKNTIEKLSMEAGIDKKVTVVQIAGKEEGVDTHILLLINLVWLNNPALISLLLLIIKLLYLNFIKSTTSSELSMEELYKNSYKMPLTSVEIDSLYHIKRLGFNPIRHIIESGERDYEGFGDGFLNHINKTRQTKEVTEC